MELLLSHGVYDESDDPSVLDSDHEVLELPFTSFEYSRELRVSFFVLETIIKCQRVLRQ